MSSVLLDGTERLAALTQRKTDAGDSFPRCALLVLCGTETNRALPAMLAGIPADVASLLTEITVLFEAEGADLSGLPNLKNLRVRTNPRRYGYGGRRKVAFEYGLERGFDYLIVVDGDVLPPLDRLGELLAAAVLNRQLVVVGARAKGGLPANSFLLRHLLGMELKDWGSSLRLYATEVLRHIPFRLCSDDRRFDTEILIQCRALGVPVQAVTAGTFDEPDASMSGCLSVALSYRLHQLHVQRNGAFLVEHDTQYAFKHSGTGSHMQILAAIRPGTRVLDLGCSQGLLARPLAEKQVRTTGVDIGPPEKASRYLETYYRRDLENPLDLPEGRVFDYVIVADVIEHLRNRELLLHSVRRYLKPDGRLLISSPNIALWFYRLSLAVGRFEYGRRGVLDETHVHLFTRTTFRRQIERSGFRVLRQRVTSIPFELIFESTGRSRVVAALSELYHLVARIYPKMFAYQFLLEAEATSVIDHPPAVAAAGTTAGTKE